MYDACGADEVTRPAAGFYPRGTTEVTYTARDVTGHRVSCTTAIHVVDGSVTPPELTMCDMPRYTSAAQVKACGWATTREGGLPGRVTPMSRRIVDGGTQVTTDRWSTWSGAPSP